MFFWTCLFCEIFDCEHRKITAHELVERYYSSATIETQITPIQKNTENGTVSEEQEKEQELSSVGQTESIPIRSNQQTEKKEQGISNNNLEDYSCYYCEYKTNNEHDYQQHVARTHGRPAYPNKTEIEKLGLKPQGKSWEM